MKPALIFIHGFATGPAVWKAQVNAFQNDLYVTTDLDSLKQLKEVFILGWSMGGWKAMELYFANPKKVKGLILVSAFAKYLKSDDYPHGTSPARLKKLKQKFMANYIQGMRYFYDLIFRDENMHKLIDTLPVPDKPELEMWFEKLKTEDFRKELPKINVPVQIIHGDKDPIVPTAAAYYLHENIRNSKLSIFPEEGHAPFVTQPQEFNQRIKKFINTC